MGYHTDMRREERVQLELHREIVRKLRRDPAAVTRVMSENLRRSRARLRSPQALGWLDRWESLVGASVGELAEMCMREDELGVDMRQVSPFAGALSQPERLAAIGRATAHAS